MAIRIFFILFSINFFQILFKYTTLKLLSSSLWHPGSSPQSYLNLQWKLWNKSVAWLILVLTVNKFVGGSQPSQPLKFNLMTTRNPIAIDDDSWFTSSDSKSKKSAKGFTNNNIPVINMVITMILHTKLFLYRDVVKIE